MLNSDEIISEIYKSFNQDNVILFLGSDAINNGELTKILCSMPWSCVITTIRKVNFGTEFILGREVQRYNSLSELPINIFNREKMPIIQILGSEDEVMPELEDYEEDLRPIFLKKYAVDILTRVMSKMDIRSRMVVVGYNPESDKDLSLDDFIFSCREIKGGTISFFNSEKKENKSLKEFAEKKDYIWVNGKLSDMLSDLSYEYDYSVDLPSDDVNLLYKGKKPVFVKKSVLLRSRSFAQLLTEEKIKEIRPLGRIQQSRWFYNFLNNSPDSPQWYGFLPQSEFYLKRNYENVLLELVELLLSGKGLNKNEWNTPIILEGDPGSSKSIELAAVAYKVYEKKINPVIYIVGDSFYFAGESNELQVLDELMQEVEQTGDQDTRFLIVWDGSSYKNIASDAKQLAHELENRGRRFVLLCSAYSNMPSDKERRTYYSHISDHVFEEKDAETGVYFCNSCYFVSATRNLDENEINTLKQKAILYGVADRMKINSIWEELSGNTNIFEYFYKLIILLRPKLEAGLSREQRMVNRYIRKQLSLFEKKDYTPFYPLAEAFQKAGIDIDNSLSKMLDEDEEQDDKYNLDKFNMCIAIFSRFKLDTPYSLALKMLCNGENNYLGESSYYDDYELFKLLTSQINYIHFCEQTGGKFVFRFRSVLEAEIFLKNNQVNEELQLEIVGEIIDKYIESYRLHNEVDYELKKSIQSILKMYGPNTDYREFWEGHKSYVEHQEILSKLEPLADKVHELRAQYRIPDDDGGMALIEISFYRELYGNLWDKLHNYSRNQAEGKEPWDVFPEVYTHESYRLRLAKLAEVSDIALESFEKMEVRMHEVHDYPCQRTLQAMINSLTVELAESNSAMERIGLEYKRFIGQEKFESEGTNKPLSYLQLSSILFKAISASPLDGYLYNVLFKLFEKEYENVNEEQKLFLLSNIGMIADDASTLEITSRGANDKDELSTHLHRIAQYSCSYKVTIDDIINNVAPEVFMNLFKRTINRNSASGICFVCQQELNKAGLSGVDISRKEKELGEEYVLNDIQLEVCKKIVKFISNPDYCNCIENSIQALYLLLRVQWMLYNKRPLSIGREWQKTYLEPADWLKIYTTCEKYENISGTSVRPIVTLIYALAKVHINKDYLGAVKAMRRLSEMPNQRMRVPYLICIDKGKPEKYSGIVVSTHNYSGFLKVDGLPRFSEKNQGVKFYMKNIGKRRMPERNTLLKNFGLGLSFTGQYSAYMIPGEESEIE